MTASSLRIAERVRGVAPYATQAPASPIDLWLDANEGPPSPIDLVSLSRRLASAALARYPSARDLEAALADRRGVDPARVLVTAGGDDAIDRACRAVLDPGRELILPVPTFEMIRRYASLAGAGVIDVPWPCGPYPTQRVLDAVTPRTSMIAMVSPNNPTGAVATRDDLAGVSRAAPDAVILVDAAYAEFADDDLTDAALPLPNALVVRTFSKAFGLAGLRVGYCIGPADLISAMRAAGGPYPVSTMSVLAAREALSQHEDTLRDAVARVRWQRDDLSRRLSRLGAAVVPSQANFVLARFTDASWVWGALVSQGILVRRFAAETGLTSYLRITLPGTSAAYDRLCAALDASLAPQTVLFDLDALAALVQNGLGPADGRPSTPLPTPLIQQFDRLAARVRLALITSQSPSECYQFLARSGLGAFFQDRRDAVTSPPHHPTVFSTQTLANTGAKTAWAVLSTPESIRAARAAGIVPIGIQPSHPRPPHTARDLAAAGAARVITDLADLERTLP
jgi:histidinol-phosphate aminotransferase